MNYGPEHGRPQRRKESATGGKVEDLIRHRYDLRVLIYTMEHDSNITAFSSRLTVLRQDLDDVERRIKTFTTMGRHKGHDRSATS